MPEKSRQRAKQWVAKAIAFYNQAGQTVALAEFSNPRGPFVRDDMYIFVVNFRGTMLAHGVNDKYIGQNFMDVKDANGKKFIQEIIESARSKDSGWVEYVWYNPVSKDDRPKQVYFEKVNDLIICSGDYKEMWASQSSL